MRKTVGIDAAEAEEMYLAANRAGVVHMTAFTYRFAPAMRYLKHLTKSGALGEPRHFRSQRFLDLPDTHWGWRQYKAFARAGDLFYMTIHRLELGMDLLGPLHWICGAVARFAERDQTAEGKPCRPSEVGDWSSMIGEFREGGVGVWEGTTLAKRGTPARAFTTSGQRSTDLRVQRCISSTLPTPFCWERPPAI